MTTATTAPQTIPGPRGLPGLGWRANILKMYLNPFTYLRWLHDTYGDVVALAQGDPSNVVAFGPALNFRLLSDPDLFRNDAGPFKFSDDTAFGRLMQNNLPTMNGEKHRQHRRLMQPAFHRQQVTHYRDDMVMLAQSMLDSWQGRTELDAATEMKLLTQRIAVKTLFGLYDEAEVERMGKLLLSMTRSMLLVMIAPVNIPGTPYHRVLRIVEEMEAMMRSLIAQKREQSEATDVLAALVHAYDEGGVQLSDEELMGHAITLFVAGHETTANTLAWIIFLLDQHPRVQADLLDELSDVLHGEAPTIEQLKQLPLLDSVVKEGLRLLPPAAIGT
ncbi:MAG: cytochrome P450, partial [Ktedonobacteraceae bacterium]|nr:cytochrome P450 [Ktedonobacteraceae bacterium]